MKGIDSVALPDDGLHLLQLLLLHQEAVLHLHLDGGNTAFLHKDEPHAEYTTRSL